MPILLFLPIAHREWTVGKLLSWNWADRKCLRTVHSGAVCCQEETPVWTYPSPSSVIAVSAKTLSTSPTVVFSLQSIPRRQLSSASWRPIHDTTTRYRVRPECTLSSFTACNTARVGWQSDTVASRRKREKSGYRYYWSLGSRENIKHHAMKARGGGPVTWTHSSLDTRRRWVVSFTLRQLTTETPPNRKLDATKVRFGRLGQDWNTLSPSRTVFLNLCETAAR